METDFAKKYMVKIHVSFIVGALILLYWQTFSYWVHTWITDWNHRFGFIIPLLFLYIIWERRDIFETAAVKPSKWGLPIIIVGILLYVGGQLAYIKVAQQLSFFIIIPGLTLYYFGFRILGLMAIPFIVLLFMAPPPDFLYTYIQSFIAWSAGEILRILNFPVYVEGYSIQVLNTSVYVAPGCTGLRSLTAILPLGLVIAHLKLDSAWKKSSMVVFAAILPILSNLSRIVVLLIFAIKGNPIFVTGTPHKVEGYIFFFIDLFLLYAFMIFLEHVGAKQPAARKEILPNPNSLARFWTQSFSSYGNFICIALLLLLPAVVQARIMVQSERPLRQSFNSFPLVMGQWEGRELAEGEWHPVISGATDNLSRLYRDADGCEIEIFVSYLPIQRQGQELVFFSNKIIPPEFTHRSREEKIWNIHSNHGSLKLETNFYHSSYGNRNEALLYWYQNTNHYFSNKYKTKIFMILDSFWKNRSNGSVFVLKFKSISPKLEDSQIKLQDFLDNFMGKIVGYLPS